MIGNQDQLLDNTGLLIETNPEQSDLNQNIEDQPIFHEPTPSDSTMWGSFQIMVNTAIGSGTLMVPYCYNVGIGLSLFISFFFAALCYFTLSFMAESGHFTHKYDYRGLFAFTFGKNRLWMVNTMIALVQFGASMIYSHWNGRLVPILIGTAGDGTIWSKNWFWIMLVCIIFVLPLISIKSIKKLESWAVLSSFCIILLICHAAYWFIIHTIRNGFDPNHKIKWFSFNEIIIASFAVNSMAYNCHLNYFSTLEHLKQATVGRGRKLALYTASASFVLYNLFGLFTYLDFFDTLGPTSPLEYYKEKSIFTKIVIFGLIFLLILSVPIVVWAARKSINSMFFNDTEFTPIRWFTIGALISIFAALLASTSDNVLLFFHIVGGMFTPTIIFFMPSFFYIKNQRNEPKWRILIAWFIALFTIVAAALCTYRANSINYSFILKLIKTNILFFFFFFFFLTQIVYSTNNNHLWIINKIIFLKNKEN